MKLIFIFIYFFAACRQNFFTAGNKKERPCLTLVSARGLVLAAASLPHAFIKQHLQALEKRKKKDEAAFVGLQE